MKVEITIRSEINGQVLQKIFDLLAGGKETRVSKGTSNGRGPNKKKGIGQSVNTMIRKGLTNDEIFNSIKRDFPDTGMRGPTSVNYYRSAIRVELRNKRADTRKRKLALEKRLKK